MDLSSISRLKRINMDQGAQRIYDVNHLYNHTTALAEFSRCLDKQFKYLENWESFAFILNVPQDVICKCKLHVEYSPTIRLFKYLEVTRPQMTIDDLRNALTRNRQRARFDLDRMLKDFSKKLKISEAITNSTSDIMENVAFKLDSASAPTCTWIDFGLELGIDPEKLDEFEMYTSYNPTEALFRFLYATSKETVKASVIVGYLEKMNRQDILKEVRSIYPSAETVAKDAQNVFRLGSELLDYTSRKLNKDSAGVNGWKSLAHHLIADHYIDDKDIISKLEPQNYKEIQSPTKKIIEWLLANYPDLTMENLITTCELINRPDAMKVLYRHFFRPPDISYHEPRSPFESSPTTEHILKDDLQKSFGLPERTTTMIGRAEEKKRLVAEILKGENRLIVLHAATGYGKETLAVETAYELIEKHDYICIYVASEGILNVKDLANNILTICGIQGQSAAAKKRVKKLFKTVGIKCLLILDNFDHTFHADDERKYTQVASFDSQDGNYQKDMSSKEDYQAFVKEMLRSSSNLIVLATTWESFFAEVSTKQVKLPQLTHDDSKELLLHRCESVLGIERSSIPRDLLKKVLKYCDGIPQLLHNAVSFFVKFGIEAGASRLAIAPDQLLELLSSDDLSPKQRVISCLDTCFDRLPKISQKVLMMISVFPGSFSLERASKVFKAIIPMIKDLEYALSKLMDFSFLSYHQEQKSYYLRPSMKSFAIYKATRGLMNSSKQPPTTSESDGCFGTELSHTYKRAISRFVYDTFAITLNIENDFFSKHSANAIQRYRKQEANLREIANWCISDKLSNDPEMKRLRYYIIKSFMARYLVNIKLMEASLLETILFRFSRFCHRCDDSKNKSAVDSTKKEYVECLTYCGVTCILGCLCVPQLCPVAQKQAMWYFTEVLKALCSSSPSDQLKIVSNSKTMSKGAQTQFLLKYGKCLVWQGRKVEGLKFVKKGVAIREEVFKKSKSTKDRVMVAVGYNDLASAYSYSNYLNGRAIQIRENKVLPVYEEHLGRHPFTASAYSHLAHDYLTLHSYQEALNACDKALSYRKRLLGTHSETARSLFDMGRILRKKASQCENSDERVTKYSEALFYLREALRMRERLLFTSKDTLKKNRLEIEIVNSLLEEEAKKH